MMKWSGQIYVSNLCGKSFSSSESLKGCPGRGRENHDAAERNIDTDRQKPAHCPTITLIKPNRRKACFTSTIVLLFCDYVYFWIPCHRLLRKAWVVIRSFGHFLGLFKGRQAGWIWKILVLTHAHCAWNSLFTIGQGTTDFGMGANWTEE